MAAGRTFDRRDFLRIATTGVAGAASGCFTLLSSCDDAPTDVTDSATKRTALRVPADVAAAALALTAAAGSASVGNDALHYGWLFNGSLPGPTIRTRRGEDVRIRLLNQLPEQTIVHWHGLVVPASADGHPRDAIEPGAQYEYTFPIVQRAGTYWYHPHAHHRTAGQIHRGLAGFFIVADDEEDALRLPAGSREVLLMLQDRRSDSANPLSYPSGAADHLNGVLGDVPFGNGVRLPSLEVTADRYRFRVLNASNARVYRLALSNGAPLTVIGNDGGLLPSAVTTESVFLGVGERCDLLIDFAGLKGQRLMLKTLPFAIEGLAGHEHPQGMEMDLLEIRVNASSGATDPPLPANLSHSADISPAEATAAREFLFLTREQSGAHEINGKTFDMYRVDATVPLGQAERWSLTNGSRLPHPVHMHGTQFQIATRTGGRNTVYPYERGWKDTVLVMPFETVEVFVRFERYRGVFPLHCHNLQHEDMGMMLNVDVV